MSTVPAYNRYRLSHLVSAAAAVQIAGTILLTAVTSMWALLIVAFSSDSGSPSSLRDGEGWALAVGLPVPALLTLLIVGVVRASRQGVGLLIAVEAVSGALVAAGGLALLTSGGYVYFPVLACCALYIALAAAVVVPLTRARRA